MTDEPLDRARRELYAAAPEEFMATRRAMVERLRKDGESDAANEIGSARKPTLAAWVVNALVLRDPGVVQHLAELADRLRAAQDALDTDTLRGLTRQRRELVGELCRTALDAAGRTAPSGTLVDEVRNTFDAAVADPEVTARLGRLQRAESWSGFGFGAGGGPQLTMIRGGRESATPKGNGTTAKDPDDARNGGSARRPAVPAAEKRRRERAVRDARRELDESDSALGQLMDQERTLRDTITRAERTIRRATQTVKESRAELDDVRVRIKQGKDLRRTAQRGLDHAERDASD